MKEKKLSYWKFLHVNNYLVILLFLIVMLIIGITQFDVQWVIGEWIWVGIFSSAIILILIKGFWLHWKEYNKKQ